MSFLTRRWLLIAVPLVVILLVAAVAFLLLSGESLRSRSERITVGMPREQVVDLLGRPELELPRTARDRGDRGAVLVWVDQFWQVDVLTGPDGRVESVDYTPSDSFYRRTLGRIIGRP